MNSIGELHDLKHLASELESRVTLPGEYLRSAIAYSSKEAINKYEETPNGDAYCLACVMSTFACQLDEILNAAEALVRQIRKTTWTHLEGSGETEGKPDGLNSIH